jgi:hypothetical protein
MNNKGFAISGILYSILIIFVASIAIMLYNLQNKKTVLDQIKLDAVEAVNLETKVDYITEKYNKCEEELKDLASGKGNNYNSEGIYQEALLNGAYPVLSDKLIPVVIEDDGTVKRADLTTSWYSYEDKVWANAVILKKYMEYAVNNVIPEDNIDAYFVWIPRYKYKLWNTGTASKLAHSIEIVFESKDTEASTGSNNGEYLTHPAFTSFDVNGIWVGKFETSGTTSDIDVKPNATSLTNQTVSKFFELGYKYNRTLDSHMMKNTEWGAVAYLSHSIYGIDRRVNINNSGGYYITGSSALLTTNQQTTPGEFGKGSSYYAAYNTQIGYLASTTGNISGIYDMSGGAWEYMAAYISENYGSSSGFTTDPITTYGSKYFDVYTGTSYDSRILGDATGEMGPFNYYTESNGTYYNHNSWYGDLSTFISSSYPWFSRGGNYYYGVLVGQFAFGWDSGGAKGGESFRLVLAF